MRDVEIDLVAGVAVAVAFLLGIVGHHWAHARAAIALGDSTPRLMGRATFRPKAHADTLGSIIMPAIFVFVAIFSNPFGVMFGWGKAQSTNPRAFKNPKRDSILVSLAGPAATLAIAMTAGVVARYTSSRNIYIFFSLIAVINSFMTVIELLPIPGRDGGKILTRFLKPHAAMRFEEFTQYDVLFLLLIFMIFVGTIRGMVRPLCNLALTVARCPI